MSGFSHAYQDSVKYDRSIQGRPFDLEQMLESSDAKLANNNGIPDWVLTGELASDTIYYGVGKSKVSQDEADNDARLRFAQFVEVSVQSIAVQQIAENKDRLEENYSYESLVTTNMSLRSIKVGERYVTPDSTFYSLIKYGKSEYHALVTQEIQVSLESDIRNQSLAHQAQEALRADSLRHKIKMDSLTLSRKQAVIDSLDRVLAMEQRKQRQEQERIDLIKNRYASFLKLKPRYLLIDVPSAGMPDSWIYVSARWNPESSETRQLSAGISVWLFSLESSLWATSAIIDQADFSAKLQVLPLRGEIFPVSLAFGWTKYLTMFAPENRVGFNENTIAPDFIDRISNEIRNPYSPESSFFAVSTLGIPQMNSHFSLYYDKRKLSLGSIWYPFPRNLGDAISIVNQVDFIRSSVYRNRFNDALQWQFGIRLIAISDRFATMLSYEDHETWMLNFEFQY